MKRKVIKVLAVLILLGAGVIAYQFYQTKQQSDALAFEAVDMGSLRDGSYEGECHVGLVQVRLRLQIQDTAIQRIELLRIALCLFLSISGYIGNDWMYLFFVK